MNTNPHLDAVQLDEVSATPTASIADTGASHSSAGEEQIRRLIQSLESFQSNEDTDVHIYFGPIERLGYELLCESFEASAPPRRNATLILSTYGGDPHAAFRIARALSHRYPDGKIKVLVPGWCKSAGTLICIGADELLLADCSELGPLDVQVLKPDEMIGRMSGLDILRGMESLKGGILDSFRQFLVDINTGTGMSTKSAADVATKLAIGIYEPILQQVDPMRLGEMEAALQIAFDYGSRLDERFRNLRANALQRLVNAYPSHSFVIDRKEAKTLFKRVRRPGQFESIIATICTKLSPLALNPTGAVEVKSLNKMIEALKQKLPQTNSELQGESDENAEPTSSHEAPLNTNASENELEPSESREGASNDHDASSGVDDSPTNEGSEAPSESPVRQRRNRRTAS
ncbi:hypothetical protein ASL22_08465 [Alcaligenes faecalis]|nr:hypothetical protein ASL22_08465 [Alcaligenes faecalis]